MNNELVLSRFNLLPENLRFQVMDYIEFLISRYSDNKVNNAIAEQVEEISPELKEFLKERIKAYEENPDNVCTWDEIEERLLKKYQYEV